MKSSFRIAHGQRELTPWGDVQPAGPIQVVASNHTSSAPAWQGPNVSRKGVKYPGLRGASRYPGQEVPATREAKDLGFPIALRLGVHYLQRHGTHYRLDKLLANGTLERLKALHDKKAAKK